jgi:peptidoglycan/LPS O-acetylase OafA/YrhL
MFSIPAFLFVSGYFIAFATGRKANVQWSIIGARIKSLLIPYILWTTLIMLGNYLLGDPFSIGRYLTNLLFGRAAQPYYYVPLLVQFYLLSPLVIIPLAKRNWKALLVGTAVLQAIVYLARYPMYFGVSLPVADRIVQFTPGWFFPATIFYFSLGVVIGFNLKAFKAWLGRWKKLFLIGVPLFFVMALVEWELIFYFSPREWLPPATTFLDAFYALSVVLAFVGYEKSKVPAAHALNDVGVKSYGIYLSHAPVQEWVSRLSYHFLPWILGSQFLFIPLLIVTGLFIPILMMNVLNRTPARRYYQYIFG